jgi:hypothetical protein
MRRAMIAAVWLALAVGTASTMACTRIVELGAPDAGTSGGPDSGLDGAVLPDGGIASSDGGAMGDGAIGDASVPDAL